MKKLLILFILISQAFIFKIASATVSTNSLNLLTMNVHCQLEDWKFRTTHIINKIAELSPDVISFQEVCVNPKTQENQIDFIKDYLLQKGYPVSGILSVYTHNAWDLYDEYLLIVSKRPIAEYDKGLLPPSLLQRGFVALKIDSTWFINTHLEYRADNVNFRIQQIDFLKNRYQNSPHVIMGDFNSSPNSFEQEGLAKSGYLSLFPDKSFLGNDGNFAQNIDGFWISPSLKNSLNQANQSVQLNYYIDGRPLSDHYAVQAFLEFK